MHTLMEIALFRIPEALNRPLSVFPLSCLATEDKDHYSEEAEADN